MFVDRVGNVQLATRSMEMEYDFVSSRLDL